MTITYRSPSNLSDACSNYLTPTEEQKERLACTDGQDSKSASTIYNRILAKALEESLCLPKEYFLLNLEYGSSGCPTCVSKDEWLTSYLIDHLKEHLATYAEVKINNEGKTTEIRIYYDEALQMLKIGAYNPVPPYVIQFSHLTPRLQTELDQLQDIDLRYVLKQAVSRIFEDIDLELYHNSISRVLWVVLQR
jgi:hypothetical protein